MGRRVFSKAQIHSRSNMNVMTQLPHQSPRVRSRSQRIRSLLQFDIDVTTILAFKDNMQRPAAFVSDITDLQTDSGVAERAVLQGEPGPEKAFPQIQQTLRIPQTDPQFCSTAGNTDADAGDLGL